MNETYMIDNSEADITLKLVFVMLWKSPADSENKRQIGRYANSIKCFI